VVKEHIDRRICYSPSKPLPRPIPVWKLSSKSIHYTLGISA
jgi:hypothetical protein